MAVDVAGATAKEQAALEESLHSFKKLLQCHPNLRVDDAVLGHPHHGLQAVQCLRVDPAQLPAVAKVGGQPVGGGGTESSAVHQLEKPVSRLMGSSFNGHD